MWIGNTVYFLSDRGATTNVYSYKTDTKELKQLTHHDDYDVMTASATQDAIVYEQAGYLHLLDTKTGQSKQLAIDVSGDLPWARPQFKRVAPMIRDAALSPTGVRAVFAARGDIFTVPTDKGDSRNLTRSTAVHDRTPAWSPDGAKIAWFSDASGEYQLMIGDQAGVEKPRVVSLPAAAFYSTLEWSPDGKHLSFADNHLNLWSLDAATGKATKIDADTYADPIHTPDPVWSSDSRWIAYSKSLDNHLRAIFVYSIADGKTSQVTDGMSDAVSPAFDAGGKYLYFLASTNVGPQTGWLEMSSLDRPTRRSVYVVVLSAQRSVAVPARVGRRARGRRPGARQGRLRVRIDFAGIGQRILAIAVPAADYASLVAGPAGTIFYAEPMGEGAVGRVASPDQVSAQGAHRRAVPRGHRSYTLSADKKKLMYGAPGARWGVVATDRPARVGDGLINVAQLEAWVDPRAEWAEIFKETWRIERDYFYDAKMHGADWNAVYKKYAPFLPSVGHRNDLGYLIALTGGELAVGHSYLSGPGDEPDRHAGARSACSAPTSSSRTATIAFSTSTRARTGIPSCARRSARRASRLRGRLSARGERPPARVRRRTSTACSRARRQSSDDVIRVNKTPTLEGSRLVTVVPVASEDALRSRAWVERNRHVVDSLSGGSSPTCGCRTPAPAATPTSRATTTRSRRRTARSSTSATTRAARSPTTSSTSSIGSRWATSRSATARS